MRPLRSLLIYILVVFIGGALLAPWLYWLVQSFAHTAPKLANSPFHRYVNRSLLVLALIGIWPLLRSLGAKSFKEIGLVNPIGQTGKLAGGFALGFGSLACVAIIVLTAHGRVFTDLATGKLAGKMISAALTAIVVSILEELLFRGAIFGGLRRIWNWHAALLLSSMIYAIVHFMKRAELVGPVTWHSGLELLPQMLSGFGNLHVVIPGFFNLTLAGIILGYAYQKTGNLYFSIGLHAGWIFWLKSYRIITAPVQGANVWFWGSDNLIDGWLALVVLAVALVVLIRLPLSKPKERGA
ncbi:MAG: Abortive infection protein [Pedosphaera sp.]|nr:Abortive infection protein [Pedosphaera sp.]